MANDPNKENETLENEQVASTEDQSTETTEETTEEVKKEMTAAQKLGALKRQETRLLKENPELAEKGTSEEAPKEQTGLNPKDIKALMDVDEADWDELQDFAKFKNISISDAKSHSVMSAMRKENAEIRKTENAQNTSKTKQTENISGSAINQDLIKKGKVPAKGSAEAEELFWARRGGRRD